MTGYLEQLDKGLLVTAMRILASTAFCHSRAGEFAQTASTRRRVLSVCEDKLIDVDEENGKICA